MQTEFTTADAPDLTDTAKQEWDDAKQRLSDAANRVKSEAAQAGSTASGLIIAELDRRRSDLGSGLRKVTQAMRRAADDLDAPSGLVEQTASAMESAVTTIEQNSVSDLSRRLGQFGRINPAVFIGGCILTGLIAGRFLSSGDGPSVTAADRDDDLRTPEDFNLSDRQATGTHMYDETPGADLRAPRNLEGVDDGAF